MMAEECFGNNWVHMYMDELTSRIVAKSGIPSDRFHLGKIILQSLQDDPDFVMQIDGATGKSETNGSVLKRTIRCATSLKKMGLKKDDVAVLMAPNHLDLAIPFYAGWSLGLAVAPTDRTMNTYDLKYSFEVVKPKIVFCQSEKVQDVQKAIELLKTDTKVISFDKSLHTISLAEMMEKYGEDVEEFKIIDLDPEETIALLISTSGTTGLPKAAALTHKNVAIAGPYAWSFSTKFPSPTRSVLLTAPLQWLSTLLNFVISPFLKYSRVQTSGVVTPQHLYELIIGYKPTFLIISPTVLTTLMKNAAEAKCDFSSFELIYTGGSTVSKELLQQMKPTFCTTSPSLLTTILNIAEENNYDLSNFELLYVGGSAVSVDLLNRIKKMSPKTIVQDTYAMSELGSLAFQCVGAPPGSCGQRNGHLQYRLIDVETKKDIKEPHKSGELWLKGPGVFKGYYNNQEATAAAFAEDNWFMTGDLMYRDEKWNFYFVDRIKLLLKYKNHQISPVELENVIRQHPSVLDVAVTGVPVAECGELPVACVVPRPGCQPTAQEIKDLVKGKLSDSKRLRGGVLFMSELPLTPSTKLHRRKLKEIVMEKLSELNLETE